MPIQFPGISYRAHPLDLADHAAAPEPLTQEAVHLWCVEEPVVISAGTQALWSTLLTERELERHQRLLFEKDRNRFLLTRVALRSLLSRYYPQVTAEQWGFSVNAYGRPLISHPARASSLKFNISHTQGMIVIAFCIDADPGVDIENIQRESRTVEVAERYFSAAEVADLRCLPKEQQRARFFDLWTLKEAYIKACGMGLAIPLKQFSFAFAEPSPDPPTAFPLRSISVNFAAQRQDDPAAWHFWQFYLSPQHRVALALKHASQHPCRLSLYRFVPELND